MTCIRIGAGTLRHLVEIAQSHAATYDLSRGEERALGAAEKLLYAYELDKRTAELEAGVQIQAKINEQIVTTAAAQNVEEGAEQNPIFGLWG